MSDPATDARTDAPGAGHPPAYAAVHLAVPMRATEANYQGNIHGGEIVKAAVSAAGFAARRHSGGTVVTAYLDEMVFLHPVHVGDILHTASQVNWVGRTSLEVGVRIETEHFGDASGQRRHVASAYFVMVALDERGRPRPVLPLLPRTPEERRRHREAQIRRTHRLARKAEIEAGRRAE